jgi:hypothetical protein
VTPLSLAKGGSPLTTAALTWPEASIYVALIGAVGLVLAVLIWSIFRTGQTAIRNEISQRALIEGLRKDVNELRGRLTATRQAANDS